MLGILIDAVVLMALLKAVKDEDAGFGISIVVALVASIGTTILAIGLTSVLGVAGIVLAAVVATVALLLRRSSTVAKYGYWSGDRKTASQSDSGKMRSALYVELPCEYIRDLTLDSHGSTVVASRIERNTS